MKGLLRQMVLFYVIVSFAGVSAGVWFRGNERVELRTRGFLPTIPEMIVSEALRAGVPADLALGVAWRESRFQPGAISATRDSGVMQLHDTTVRALHVADPLDARQNIVAGVGLLGKWFALCIESDSAALYGYAHGKCPGGRK